MAVLTGGLALFFLAHIIPTLPAVRTRLVRWTGRGVYRALFALLSLAGLVLIVRGYGEMHGLSRGNPQLWVSPRWVKHVVLLLMIPAVILLLAAYVPSRIRTAVRHPMLTAVIIWAFGHLLANGDLASVLLFGSFLAFAVYDRVSVASRPSPGPLGNATGGSLHDILVLSGGLGLYMLMLFWGHAKLTGVALLP